MPCLFFRTCHWCKGQDFSFERWTLAAPCFSTAGRGFNWVTRIGRLGEDVFLLGLRLRYQCLPYRVRLEREEPWASINWAPSVVIEPWEKKFWMFVWNSYRAMLRGTASRKAGYFVTEDLVLPWSCTCIKLKVFLGGDHHSGWMVGDTAAIDRPTACAAFWILVMHCNVGEFLSWVRNCAGLLVGEQQQREWVQSEN